MQFRRSFEPISTSLPLIVTVAMLVPDRCNSELNSELSGFEVVDFSALP
jgi:hypothetical protein